MAKKATGEKAMKEPAQQHGELASTAAPKPLSDKQMMKHSAKHTCRRATEDWVDGRITTDEHKAIHARAKHVISGKEPREFKGKSGERKVKW